MSKPKESTQTLSLFDLNCSIVYRSKTTNQVEVLPLLDLNRKGEVWGIEVDNLKISRRENVDCWSPGMEKAHHHHEELLSGIEWEIVEHNLTRINAAFQKLNQLGVRSEPISGSQYWTCHQTPIDYAITYQLGQQNFLPVPKTRCYRIRTTLK